MPQDNPPLLDKTMNTTEQTSRNLADVLAEELKNIANNVKPDGSDISINVPGMSANNVDDGFSELKQSLDNKADKVQIGITTSSVNSVSFTIKPSSASNALIIATRREGNGNNDGVALIKVYNGTPFATVIGGNITISNLTFDTSTNTITFTIGTYYNVVCIAN